MNVTDEFWKFLGTLGLGGIVAAIINAVTSRVNKKSDSSVEHEKLRNERDMARDSLVSEILEKQRELGVQVAELSAKLTICLSDKERMGERQKTMQSEIERLAQEKVQMQEEIRELNDNVQRLLP